MASSVQPLIQIALITCQEHDGKEFDMYCMTCKKAVCFECVKSKHIHHDVETMSTYTRKLRGRAHIKALEVNSVIDSLYEGSKRISDYWNDTNDKECSKALSELEKARSRLHDLIDGIIDDRKKEVQTFYEEKKDQFSFKGLENSSKRLKKMTLQLDEEKGTLSDFDIIELYIDINQLLSTMASSSECSAECFEHVRYEKGEVENEKLEKMVGSITRESPKLLNTLSLLKEINFQDENEEKDTQNDYSIYCIRPVSDTSAWISFGNRCINVNITDSDNKSEVVFLRYFDVSNTGMLYSFDKEDKSIYTINKSGETKDLLQTTPLIPVCLSVTHSGDLLISLVDELIYARAPTSRRLLRRMTVAGLTLKEYEYDNDGKKTLFTVPGKAVEHYHGQVCVINGFINEDGRGRGVVYGLDPAGRVQYKYNNSSDKFHPIDICSDMMGNSLILDAIDGSLHCVDFKGCLLRSQQIRTCLDIDPNKIALYENTFWVGSHKTGQVKVYEYSY